MTYPSETQHDRWQLDDMFEDDDFSPRSWSNLVDDDEDEIPADVKAAMDEEWTA